MSLKLAPIFWRYQHPPKFWKARKNPSYTTLCNAARNFAVLAVAALAFVLAEGP